MSFETIINIMIFIADHPYIVLTVLTMCLASVLWMTWCCFKTGLSIIMNFMPDEHVWKKERDDYRSVMIGKYKMTYTTPEGNAYKYNELKGIQSK